MSDHRRRRRAGGAAPTDRAPRGVGSRRRQLLTRGGAFTLVTTLTASLLVAGTATAPSAAADSTTQCQFPNKAYTGRPWSLQRVLLDQLWKDTKGKGARVAVIDTGVDVKNKQLKDAVDTKSGANFLPKAKDLKKKSRYEQRPSRGKKNGTSDRVGHGTKVAGIIAARPAKGTGFVGLAPESTIIPIQQNDENGSGNVGTLATSIRYAVNHKADVINISQDTEDAIPDNSTLQQAIEQALKENVVVVASAGNDGLGGKVKATYPASYEGVLAVASSDRNNERAPFSQSGSFVDIAAPGVDMISTVPHGGHCADNGTSFSAPYVAGVAALLKAKHKDWDHEEIAAQLEQTAERNIAGRDRLVGWGVIDPVRALTEDNHPIRRPVANEGVSKGEGPTPAKLQIGESEQERNARIGTYVLVAGAVLVAVVGGTSLIYRDWRRKRGLG